MRNYNSRVFAACVCECSLRLMWICCRLDSLLYFIIVHYFMKCATYTCASKHDSTQAKEKKKNDSLSAAIIIIKSACWTIIVQVIAASITMLTNAHSYTQNSASSTNENFVIFLSIKWKSHHSRPPDKVIWQYQMINKHVFIFYRSWWFNL